MNFFSIIMCSPYWSKCSPVIDCCQGSGIAMGEYIIPIFYQIIPKHAYFSACLNTFVCILLGCCNSNFLYFADAALILDPVKYKIQPMSEVISSGPCFPQYLFYFFDIFNKIFLIVLFFIAD